MNYGERKFCEKAMKTFTVFHKNKSKWRLGKGSAMNVYVNTTIGLL
jgi:hypothetical protein